MNDKKEIKETKAVRNWLKKSTGDRCETCMSFRVGADDKCRFPGQPEFITYPGSFRL